MVEVFHARLHSCNLLNKLQII
uniref:Uncharacterized protein n=1 Tax=Arundo donax TaxID=35708 RepID=A0A0A9C607_ARUDO